MKSRNRVLYYGKKAAAFLASVLLLSVLVFYISRLAPGDPLVSYYGDRVEKMTPEERAWAEEKLGLKDPISVQYIRWAGNAGTEPSFVSAPWLLPEAHTLPALHPEFYCGSCMRNTTNDSALRPSSAGSDDRHGRKNLPVFQQSRHRNSAAI